VAVNRIDDQDTVYPTIWVLDLSREGAVFRFTDPDVAQANFNPVWSPDSNEIVFSRGDDRRMRLFRQALSGGTEKPVLNTEGPKFPTDWSSDGRFVSYSSQAPDYRNLHIWLVALDVPEPRSFLQLSHEECSAQFSPADGEEAPRWLAYTSHETGRYEVYVRDFPGGQYRWQISSQGGFQPHWRRDGRELFYLTLDGKLMSVAVTISPTFEFETPAPLFPTGLHFLPQYRTWMNQYAVSRDGQRFLLNLWLPEGSSGRIATSGACSPPFPASARVPLPHPPPPPIASTASPAIARAALFLRKLPTVGRGIARRRSTHTTLTTRRSNSGKAHCRFYAGALR
jgi:eukaryotic-like serine/threonine-protein kinase